MRVYQDKETGLWKTSTNGEAIHATKKIAEHAQLTAIVDKLISLQKKRNIAVNRK